MKLIYCQNTTNKGRFTQFFDQDLVIKKGSKVGLLNAAFEFTDQVDIDSSNDRFQYKTSLGHDYINVFIPHDTYQAEQLLNQVESQLNTSLGNNGSNIGTQFKVVEDNEQTDIMFRRNRPTHLAFPDANQSNFTVVHGGEYKGTTTSGSFDSYAFTDHHLNRGSSFAKFKVKVLGDFIVGFLSEHQRPTTMDFSKFAYGIRYDSTNDVLFTIHKGVETANPFNLQVNDRLFIQQYSGAIHFSRFRGSPGVKQDLLGSAVESDYDQLLFGCVSFNNSVAELKSCTMHVDPFTTSSDLGMSKRKLDDFPDFTILLDDELNTDLDDPPSSIPPSNYTLDFELSSLGNLLGYTQSIYQLTNTIAGSFKADERYFPETSSGLLVTLPNIQLQGFNGIQRKQSNLLMTVMKRYITSNDEERNSIVFQADRPTMLSTAYDRDIIVREIQIAVLDNTFSEPVTFYDSESCSLTLVIQDPDE